MKKIVLVILSLFLMNSAFSQNPISIERIINDLDWENCTESDVILAFKDNIAKRDNVTKCLTLCELMFNSNCDRCG